MFGSRLRRTLVAIALLTGATATGCASETGAGDEEAPEAGEDALIGGAPARVDQFPATVYLKRGCTAAKVAPKKLLTAAHCVLDPSTLDLVYGPGKPVSVARDPSQGDKAYAEHVVAKVHVHPAWKAACESSYCASSSVTALLDAPDVAVIELESDLALVPFAAVDVTPLAAKERVVVLGFGCTEGVLVGDTRTTLSLKFAETSLTASSRAVHAGSPVDAKALPQVTSIYAMTPGPARNAKRDAGLCPGDSGGPLYRRLPSGALAVVGVNSNYTLRPGERDAKGLPVTNWHTRLDTASRHQIGAWLASVGAL